MLLNHKLQTERRKKKEDEQAWRNELPNSPMLLAIDHAPDREAQASINHDTVFQVTNSAPGSPGGFRFDREVGVEYARQTLSDATEFVRKTFQVPNALSVWRYVLIVDLFVEDIPDVSHAVDNVIHLSTNYVAGYTGDVRREVVGILYHEVVRVWQWDGDHEAPIGLLEGIADFVRLKAGYAPSHWVSPGQGARWDQGYDVTALFLDYCNSLQDGFVARMNAYLGSADGYRVTYFNDLLGKSVDQLWRDYKAKYLQYLNSTPSIANV